MTAALLFVLTHMMAVVVKTVPGGRGIHRHVKAEGDFENVVTNQGRIDDTQQ